MRRSDREVGDSEYRISGREIALVEFLTRRIVQQNARMTIGWRTLDVWPYSACSGSKDYGTSVSIVEQFFGAIAETPMFPLQFH